MADALPLGYHSGYVWAKVSIIHISNRQKVLIVGSKHAILTIFGVLYRQSQTVRIWPACRQFDGSIPDSSIQVSRNGPFVHIGKAKSYNEFNFVPNEIHI